MNFVITPSTESAEPGRSHQNCRHLSSSEAAVSRPASARRSSAQQWPSGPTGVSGSWEEETVAAAARPAVTAHQASAPAAALLKPKSWRQHAHESVNVPDLPANQCASSGGGGHWPRRDACGPNKVSWSRCTAGGQRCVAGRQTENAIRVQCATSLDVQKRAGDPVYMSRKNRKFRTDKFDTWNKRKFWLMQLM